jgi:hypothetical protein
MSVVTYNEKRKLVISQRKDDLIVEVIKLNRKEAADLIGRVQKFLKETEERYMLVFTPKEVKIMDRYSDSYGNRFTSGFVVNGQRINDTVDEGMRELCDKMNEAERKRRCQ